ncbi:MAG TPA: cytochrome c biogenesis heme-transporting ATPase CcmA [Steroidobacteraceae bacterium]|nr:cytochrome c biogenesis heme-transporting ATPase CcmA [Steroidobacteraceae bacterium]
MHDPRCALAAETIHVWRGERHVLRGVSFAVEPGQLLHVFGPNGAGKTTLLRVVCGLLRPEQGRILWAARPIQTVQAEYQAAMAYASHEAALKADLTALENLRYAVGLKRRVQDGELRTALERTGVGACADLPARVLSAGQRRRVALARVLAVRARLWLLDEPFANLDTKGTELMGGLLEQHIAAGGSALVVAHHALQLGCAIGRLGLSS